MNANYRFSKFVMSVGETRVRTDPILLSNTDQIRAQVTYGNQNRRGLSYGANMFYDCLLYTSIDGMERALDKLRAANGSPSWRDAVVESSAAFSRGVAELLETLQLETLSGANVPDEGLLRARRYARVRVAEMQLYAADRVTAGRTARHLYAACLLYTSRCV